jgi:hypothetical protein
MSSGDLTYGFPQRTYFLWRDGSETVGANVGIGKYFIKFYHNSATIDRETSTLPFRPHRYRRKRYILPVNSFFFFFFFFFQFVLYLFFGMAGLGKSIAIKATKCIKIVVG